MRNLLLQIGQTQILREHKLCRGWGKIGVNFPELRKSEYFTFKRSFLNFESDKLSQIRSKFEKSRKHSAPESYFIHNYSQDKLLQTTLSVINYVCVNFCG